MKTYAVNVLVIQDANSIEEAKFNLFYTLGEVLKPEDFEVTCVVETNNNPEYAFANEDAYINKGK